MADDRTKRTINVSPNPPVFDLPILVALEQGLFEKAGIDVRYTADYAEHNRLERDVLKRLKESHFTERRANSFNVCEWGGIDRIERGAHHGKIAALRPAIAAQAIVTFDKTLQTPRDLAGIAVGINEFTGSHYTTVALLEGAVGKDNVVLEHIGDPSERLKAVGSGRIRAVTVMEPFISLALKQGAHVVALTFYRGAEVFSEDLDAATRDTFLDVLDAAADLVNADFGRYAHLITATTEGQLEPHELSRHFVRYTHSQRYSTELFTPAYEWMKERGFTVGAGTHESLVVS